MKTVCNKQSISIIKYILCAATLYLSIFFCLSDFFDNRFFECNNNFCVNKKTILFYDPLKPQIFIIDNGTKYVFVCVVGGGVESRNGMKTN